MTTTNSALFSSSEGGSFSLLHPGVQKAIFQLGWKELHHIQSQCIKNILKGTGHLLVCAQTAGGKTEAAFLPIISRISEQPRSSVQALYIGPLVALINDQFQRLEQLCAHVEVPVHRWHGGASATEKRKFRDSPGGILLITPESLESNFINYGNHLRRIYADLDFVVIDELHSFLSGVRGVHLRSLLARLSAATGRHPRIVGLSATLGDPEGAREFIAPGEPETVTILQDDKMKRSIQFGIRAYLRGVHVGKESEEKLCRWHPTDALAAARSIKDEEICQPLPLVSFEDSRYAPPPAAADELDEIAEDILHTCADKTNLVFGNAKQGLEILADRLHSLVKTLRLPRDPFHVHHGSLSRELRDETETVLKSGQPATVLCSSTLEMGIDIGSVRRVAQLDPPWSVSSMLQRLGRSGRREGESAILRVYTRDQSPHTRSSITDLLFPNLLRSIALARLMLAKWLEPHDRDRMNLSTLVHQILSCLRQTGGMKATDLHLVLVQNGAFRNISQRIFTNVLHALGAQALIEQMPQGEIILAPSGERIVNDRDFYAAFASGEEFNIRWETQDIGKLASNLIPPVGENLILAGRRWCVVDINNTLKTAFVVPSKGGKAPVFLGMGGEIHSRIMQEMQSVLRDNEIPPYLDEAGKVLLSATREFARRTGIASSGVIVRSDSIQWFPWIGSRALLTLQLHARHQELSCETDALSITYKKVNFEKWCSHLQSVACNDRTALQLAGMMKMKTFERFDDTLNEELLDEANARDRLDLAAAMKSAGEFLTSVSK